MQSSRSPRWIELTVPIDRVVRRKDLNFDPASFELLNDARIRLQASISAGTDDERRGQFLDDIGQVLGDEGVPILAPPVGDNAVGEQDHVS